MRGKIKSIVGKELAYNLHTHTQYCDGRYSMAEMAQAAYKKQINILGFTPHSPIPIDSPCNMLKDNVKDYYREIDNLKEKYANTMNILCSFEVDYLSTGYGAHIDFFQKAPCDYLLSSVHFVPNKEGVLIDCDGNSERFKKNLKEFFNNDLRYVVEKYFEQELRMIELGGFDIIGHFDKIAANATAVDPNIENQIWYESMIDQIISDADAKKLVVEINTKAFEAKGRFFPSQRWWAKLKGYKSGLVINSDAHYVEKIDSGREEAILRIQKY